MDDVKVKMLSLLLNMSHLGNENALKGMCVEGCCTDTQQIFL